MNNIEEDIKRCKKLTEPQNANWIGITNQVAIARLIGRIKELEEENKRKQILLVCAEEIIQESIPMQKIKDKIEEFKNEKEQLRIDKNVIWDSQIYKIDLKIQVLEELLQESEDR